MRCDSRWRRNWREIERRRQEKMETKTETRNKKRNRRKRGGRRQRMKKQREIARNHMYILIAKKKKVKLQGADKLDFMIILQLQVTSKLFGTATLA